MGCKLKITFLMLLMAFLSFPVCADQNVKAEAAGPEFLFGGTFGFARSILTIFLTPTAVRHVVAIIISSVIGPASGGVPPQR
ncbi:hypothetical protein A7E78_03025 [Syntrophotalea acetylenivorans]|uniref:Uncharacterized protein n=1 Tax=Syntrophotalea acetylenivorans TaxID=1842532 RepID=A0A1L3GLW7_9BACT|nr:hypothetical protein A7E78_03025 [Syntrophotalea acetylenivorans]